ncbi:rRNA-binding ribosome biosynthesis protein utp25, partial [Teratosphaeriaceae sp. CCFEE 6253]
EPSDESDGLSEEEVETAPQIKAYSALLQGFQQDETEDGGRRKRRRLDVENEELPAGEEREEEGNDSDLSSDEGSTNDNGDEAQGTHDAAGVGELPEDDEDGDVHDPFEAHFANMDDDELAKRLKSVQVNQWRTEKQPIREFGDLIISVPDSVGGSVVRKPVAGGM